MLPSEENTVFGIFIPKSFTALFFPSQLPQAILSKKFPES